jgi:aerobic carbon-monoxide dehydrogenase medium subunit
MYDFEFIRAKTVDEAVKALAEDEEAMALSGGQTLLPTMKQRLASPTKLVSLAAIPGMRGVALDDEGRLVVKAATPHGQVAKAAAANYPALAALAGQIGDPAVRSRGTIGGSLANNDPSACWPAAALGSNALIRTNARDIDADVFSKACSPRRSSRARSSPRSSSRSPRPPPTPSSPSPPRASRSWASSSRATSTACAWP